MDEIIFDAEVDQEAAEIEYEALALERRKDLLAWTLRQSFANIALSDTENWPPFWVMDWPETRGVAMADPLVFDLACFQSAHDLKFEPERDLTMRQEFNVPEMAALLLETARPNPRGLPSGRIAVKMLVHDLYQKLLDVPYLWHIRIPSGQKEWVSEYPTVNAIAEAIADQLNLHPMLVQYPDCALSKEAVRAIMKVRRR